MALYLQLCQYQNGVSIHDTGCTYIYIIYHIKVIKRVVRGGVL